MFRFTTEQPQPSRHFSRFSAVFEAFRFRKIAVGHLLFAIFAGGLTLAVARAFYGYMLVQTGGEWSAPLDDVFIHFDYARATARGYPFQWSEGNGYSSGNTSLLYPFALAIGYLGGFRQNALMIWAGIVACCSVLSLILLAVPRLFAALPAWTQWLAPVALFAIGALDWSLFSGMEVAFFLAMWAIALAAAWPLLSPEPVRPTRALWLGAAGILVVYTRPEGLTSIAVLALAAAIAAGRRRGIGAFVATAAFATGPAVLALAVQALVNRAFTGEFSANGAIVKLSLYNPFMTSREKLDEYVFLLKYVVFRNVEYHFTDAQPYGYIVPALALIPFASRRTRVAAAILWGSASSWLAVVALNGQVRWQNERYTMPAVAWTLLAAALGLALLLDPGAWTSAFRTLRSRAASFEQLRRERRPLALWLARAALGVALAAIFFRHQEPRMRDQIWFFGRASRNIRDQHLTAGRLLRRLSPIPHRVLVGDAGGLMYASDLPGLDIIGLGGYHDLPFARASVHGLGATLELVEHMPVKDRPDVFAIYPTWWGDLPTWFGSRVTSVPVFGNVICGGSEKVIYRADWHALDAGEKPRTLRPGEQIVDDLDVADLVSEREHAYEFPHPGAGFVDFKILSHKSAPSLEMFDAGRRIPGGRAERFRLKLRQGSPARFIVRTSVEHDVHVDVRIGGVSRGELAFVRGDGWQEQSLEVPADAITGAIDVELAPRGAADWVDYHLWAAQRP